MHARVPVVPMMRYLLKNFHVFSCATIWENSAYTRAPLGAMLITNGMAIVVESW